MEFGKYKEGYPGSNKLFSGTNSKSEENVKAEHPVWNVLQKDKYVAEYHKQAEEIYDFIKGLVEKCGTITVDRVEILAMKRFFDMWNKYSSDTFRIMDSLVNK